MYTSLSSQLQAITTHGHGHDWQIKELHGNVHHDINIPWNMKSHLITMFSTYYPNGKNKMLPVGETHLYGSLMNHTMRGPKTFLKLV